MREKPDKSWQSYWKLASNLDSWKENSSKKYENFVRGFEKTSNLSLDLIWTILAINDINGHTCKKNLSVLNFQRLEFSDHFSFSGDFGGLQIRLIHPLGSILNHACNPNVKKYFSGITHGNYLQCRASTNITKGEKLTVSYLDLLTPFQIRQRLLKEASTI